MIDMKQITLGEIEKKALDSIKTTVEIKRGNAKSFERKEINDKLAEMFKKCMPE